MLQKMGEHIHGWIAGIFVVVIAVVFSLFGMSYYLHGSTPATAVIAKVNGAELLGQALQNSFTQTVNADPSLAAASPQKRLSVKKQLVDQWVQQQAIATSVQDAGMLVSPNVVRSFIVNFPYFQMNGAFSQMLFSHYMQQQGYLNEQQAYEGLSKQLASTNFVAAIENSGFIVPKTVAHYFSLLTQQRSFRYAMVQSSDFQNKVSVTTADLKAYYQNHLAEFKSPETVSVSYLELSPQSLEQQVQIDPNQVQQYYQNHLQNFTKPAAWTLATFSVSDLRSKYLKADNTQINKMFNDQVSALKAGKNIPAFLKTYKPVTKTANQLSKEAVKKLAALKPGHVSAVQTNNILQGNTVYYLVSKTPKHVQPFAKAKKAITDHLQQQQVNNMLSSKSDQMNSLALSNPEGLEQVAKAMGLAIQTTPAFTRKGLKSGPASSSKFVAAAFGDIVLTQGLNSDPITLADGSTVIMHVKKHTKSSYKPFKIVQAAVKKDFVQQQALKLGVAHAKQLASQLNQNKAVMMPWKTVSMATIGNKSVPAVISQAVFDKPFAVGDKAIAFVVPTDNKQAAVVQLQSLHVMPLDKMTAKQGQDIQKRLMTLQQQAILIMMQNSLKSHSSIKVHKDLIT